MQLVTLLMMTSALIARSQTVLSLEEAVNKCVFSTMAVRIQKKSLEKAMLDYEVFRKGQLPIISLNFTPISFSHSQKLLQSYDTGEYFNINEYSNVSDGEILLTQTVRFTGGTLSLGSGISMLHEFSTRGNNFSSRPFYLKYSQDLFGGRKGYKLHVKVAEIERQVALRRFCSSVATEQQKILNLYLAAVSAREMLCFYRIAVKTDSVLVGYARNRRNLGKITRYECNEVELLQLENKLELENANMNYSEAIRLLEQELLVKGIIPDDLHVGVLPQFLVEDIVITMMRKNSEKEFYNGLKIASKMYELHKAKMCNRFNGNISFTYGLNQYGKSLRTAYLHPYQRQELTVSLNIPIFQYGLGKDRVRKGITDYELAILEKEADDLDVEMLIHKYVLAYNHGMLLLDFAKQKCDLSARQYEFSKMEFRLGKITVSELATSFKNCLRAKQGVNSRLCNLFEIYYKIRNHALYDFVRGESLMDMLSTTIIH